MYKVVADGLVIEMQRDKLTLLFGTLALIMVGMLITVLQGCTLTEINIVQRATVSNGDGTTSRQHDSTAKQEEDSMEFIVPLK